MHQLELFHAMGCALSDSYIPFKRFLLQQARAPLWLLAASLLPRCRCCRCSCPTGAAAGRSQPSCAPLKTLAHPAALFACAPPAPPPSSPLQAAQHYHETGQLDAAALSAPQEGAAGRDGKTIYRCRKCRGLVATQHNVVETETGPGASAFRWRKRDKQQRQAVGEGGGGGGDEGSLFVEPLRWMGEGGGGPGGDSVVVGVIQGKLYCPK